MYISLLAHQTCPLVLVQIKHAHSYSLVLVHIKHALDTRTLLMRLPMTNICTSVYVNSGGAWKHNVVDTMGWGAVT